MTVPPSHRVWTGTVTQLYPTAKGTARRELHDLDLLMEDGNPEVANGKEATT